MLFDTISSAFSRGGLLQGLRELNSTVPHRYTGVYQLRDEVLCNIGLHDKQGEVRPDFLAEVPLVDSFCQFVLRDGVFRSNNTGEDERLNGHKYQGMLLSYHGVPVLDDHGALYGTLCHFDADETHISDEQFSLLQRVARLIPAYLPR